METDPPKADPPQPRYRLCIAPRHALFGLLFIEGLLMLSERFRWFAFNEQKGFTVLIAGAIAAGIMLILIIWFAIAAVLRWPFQFSVRSLFLLVLCISIPCRWLAIEMNAARRQREAVAAIKSESGTVEYDHWFGEPREVIASQAVVGNGRGYTIRSLILRPEPNWPRKLLGDDFFKTVVIAQVRNDAGLKQLRSWTQIRNVMCNSVHITDAGLEHLADLTQLKKLDLSDTQITDAGLKSLSRLVHLSDLSLRHTRISDAGLEYLTTLRNLHYLSLGLTHVTHEGAEKLRQDLPSCNIYW